MEAATQNKLQAGERAARKRCRLSEQKRRVNAMRCDVMLVLERDGKEWRRQSEQAVGRKG
jgi:hypothetical protein